MYTHKIISEAGRIVRQLNKFTETYKKYSHDHGKREVECLRVQFPLWMEPIADEDIFAGKGEFDNPFGFAPQPETGSLAWYFDEERTKKFLQSEPLSRDEKKVLKKLSAFWAKQDGAYQTRQAYSEAMQKALPSDNWTGEPGAAFPLYRMSGTQPDIDKLLRQGINGLQNELGGWINQTKEEEKITFYNHCKGALDVFSDVCLFYANMAREMEQSTPSEKRRNQLKELTLALQHIHKDAPVTFYQAAQLAFLYTQFSGAMNFGRMDEYLGDFLVQDIHTGVISEEQAVEIICQLWKTIDHRQRVFDSRLTLGGKGRRNEENADAFALLAMEATKRMKLVAPQVTLRFYKGQNELLMEKAMETIAAGTTYPMLYNDDSNIPAVAQAFDVPEKEAIHYIPFGCGEYTLYHRSTGTPSGVINMLQVLLIALHNGKDPVTGKPVGIETGDISTFKNFDDLLLAYCRQIEYFTEQLGYQEALEYEIAAKNSPYLLLSILYDDCLQKGQPIFEGGVRYLGGTLETYGNTNTADSLTAIKKLVFKEKKFSLEQVRDMCNTNFEGFETEREMLLDAPKFGNDHDEADAMKKEVDRHICTYTRSMREKTNLHHYLVVIINNNANTVLGRHTGASPDGRLSGTYMANGNTPSGGQDKNGITAMLNSLVKPDISLHAGATQNLKFSKSMFTTYNKQLEALLQTWFMKGAPQAMITVIDKGELEKAMEEPENYQHLVVRVGGYSAKFVDLPRDIQQEVLSRTLY